MGFLNPWLWIGMAAVAAPIWLHLRRRSEAERVQFSALRFLEDQPEPHRAPLRLRDRALFALRLLAILLIVAGFAWPFRRPPEALPIRESRVYILDNTLSHQANQGFIKARDRILDQLQAAASDIQIAVIELTGAPRMAVSFADTREAARQKLKSLSPSYQRGSYLAAFRQANVVLGHGLGDHKRIIFLGDNQQNQWQENANSPPFLDNVEVEVPKPCPTPLPNLWLSDPRVQRVFSGDKSQVNFTVNLSHQGPAKTATVTVRANGQTVLDRHVELENQPETILIKGQWEAAAGQWLRGEARVEGTPDVLPADDQVFFSLAPMVEGKVALLAQSPYLRLALSPDVMRGQWAMRLIDPATLSSSSATNQDADVLCLESNYLQSEAARNLLRQYLANERGVFLLVNRVTPVIDAALHEWGFDSEPNAGPNHPEKFQFVYSSHPIFHPFLSPDYGNLLEVRVSKYVRLRTTQALPLVLSESGAGLFFQSTRTPGKLFVAAFGLDREHTSWPVDQTFIPFLDLVLQAARAEDPAPTVFEPGEISLVQLPPATVVREVTLRDERRELIRAPVDNGKARVRMPDQPGLYELTYDKGTEVRRIFAINPSPKESQLVYRDGAERVKSWQRTQPSHPGSGTGGPRVKPTMAAILRQNIWWWMLLGSLLALMLEMMLAGPRTARG